MLHPLGPTHAANAFETRWAGAQHSQSPVGADMRDGDGTSILFRFAESVVNIAHVPKECLYYLRLPIAMSSSATVAPSSLTSTLPPPCIALTARLFVDLSKVDHATVGIGGRRNG